MNVRLTKLSDNKNAIRTSSVEGHLMEAPATGQGLCLHAPPIEEGFDVRVLLTSPVVKLVEEEQGTLKVYTENSVYRIEMLEGTEG